MPQEGVIQFEVAHTTATLEVRRYGELARKLIAWRKLMALTGLVGQRPDLYEGAAYGNVSARVGPPSAPLSRRSFLITGSQTSGRETIGLADLTVVESYDFDRNRVESRGQVHPSSESMTHAALYDRGPQIRCVLHAHSPVLWQLARRLRIPRTDASVPYGTPGMAREVQRLYRDGTVVEKQILAMGGHEDGIIVFGRSPEETGQVLMTQLAKAFELQQGDP